MIFKDMPFKDAFRAVRASGHGVVWGDDVQRRTFCAVCMYKP